MALRPALLVSAKIRQRQIANAQQAALLEVWRREAPAALQVPVQTIAKDVAQRPARFLGRVKLEIWIARVKRERQAERIKDALGQYLMR